MTTLREMNLREQEGKLPRLSGAEVAELMKQLDAAWTTRDRDGETALRREFTFADFAAALAFANRVGEVAEEENHHPELTIGWGRAVVELWTHVSGGLTLSDFVVAAKIDPLA